MNGVIGAMVGFAFGPRLAEGAMLCRIQRF
jgi:hypothetical protein